MATGLFPTCLAVTLGYEGGRVDDSKDPGGRTNKGVTQRTYDAWRRKHGLATRDVYDISDDEVSGLYFADYWTPAGCDGLSRGLDLCHFDATVNSGSRSADKWLATAQRKTGTADQVRAYASARVSSLEALRTWRTFGRGWGARVAGIEAKALAMALGTVPAAGASLAGLAASHAESATVAKQTAVLGTALTVAAAATMPAAAAATVGTLGAVTAVASAFGAWRHGLRAAALRRAAA